MPKTRYLTQAEAADELGVTDRTIRNLACAGLPRALRRGRVAYPFPECNVWYREYCLRVAAADTTGPRAKIVDLQARKLEMQIRQSETALAREQGELVTIDYVEEQVQTILLQLRTKVRNIPGQYATQFAGIRTIGEAQSRLQDMVNEILTVLADSGADPALDAELPGANVEAG